MGETWRDVIGFEGLYQVSDQGRVRSLDRIIHTKQYTQHRKGQILSTPLGTYGYPTVNINRKCRRVHQLVAEAFIGPRPKNLDTIHKDGIKTNCRSDNLRYGTHAENQLDIRKHSGNPNARKVVRSDGKQYLSLCSVEEDDFVRQNVRETCKGNRQSAGGYSWEWL